MKKDVSIENWLIRGTVFILIFTFACFVWFQYQMSITDQYSSNYKVETERIDGLLQTGQKEIKDIEINEGVEQDTTGINGTDAEEMDDIKSERNIDRFHSSKSERKGANTYS